MASNNYNPYNYPYEQSTVQQYSAYQTAPAPNNVPQPSRQYQPGTTQSTDYMSYQTQSYGGQSNAYSGTQDDSWRGGNSYGRNQEMTSRAAEVLRNMSNTNHTPNSTTAMNQPGFTATNAAMIAHHSSSTPHTQPAQQPSQTHSAQPTYAQSQTRPGSVNANCTQGSSANRGVPSPAMAASYPSQRAVTAHKQQTQPQYAQNTQTPVSSAKSAASTAATQYNDYNRRQLPDPDTAVSASYDYSDARTTAPAAQSTANNVPEMYSQGTVTVDPVAVYDPWSEYQRKQEALRARKAIEDAARAEDERIAEEMRQEEERKKEEERTRQEEEEGVRLAQMSQGTQKVRKPQQSIATDAGSASDAQYSPLGGEMEQEIRALMAKMREFNSKDPALLARIWEEERRAKAPKSPTVQSNTAPQIATTANQKKAAPTKPATPAVAAVKPLVPPAVKPLVPQAAISRSGGYTIWPPEKKSQLATAASVYLNAQNPARPLEANEVLRMLNGNPSYIELCEHLESMGLRLDRAAFAKDLLSAVPDANSTSRAKTTQSPTAGVSNGTVVRRVQVAPPAVMKRDVGTPATLATDYASAAPTQLPLSKPRYPPFPNGHAPTPVPVAEMVPIRPELKLPANKEEAARKRNFDDLIDLTQLPEDEDFEPPPKKVNTGPMSSFASPAPAVSNVMDIEDEAPANFPIPARGRPQPVQELRPPPVNELKYATLVEPLNRKKALRRNNYNIKTIARDVLLACGRHPETRQLNQHLDVLRSTLPQITNDADLSTLRWDLIDPGKPPPGYFKDSVQGLAEGADDEEDSEDEESRQPPRRSSTQGGATDQQKVQALPEAINPFKQKRRGRPPRHSLPTDSTTPITPNRSIPTKMSASAPRPTAPATGVGYSAFRSATGYDAEGKPLPKKRGRPVGWRKNIHGSAVAQARPSANDNSGHQQFVPAQPSTLRHVKTGDNEPIRIDSRSPSVANKLPRYQSYKCKWLNCKAELHNLDTLKKHVYKVHQKENVGGVLDCLWADCATEVASHDPITNMRIERHDPKTFHDGVDWQDHLEQTHFSPLSWQLGDGPASGLSD